MRILDGRHILVADDEPLIAWGLAEELEEHGALIVGPATTFDDAIALLARERVQAAVIDIQMGSQLVYALADALAARGVPFIFATGCELGTIPERYAHVPICEKPFVTGSILRALSARIVACIGQVCSARIPAAG